MYFTTLAVDNTFSYFLNLYNGTFVSSPASNPPTQIQALLKQGLSEYSNQTAFDQTLQKIQSIAVEQQYQVYLYDLYDNKAYATTKVSSFINFPGDHPDVPDYYAMSP